MARRFPSGRLCQLERRGLGKQINAVVLFPIQLRNADEIKLTVTEKAVMNTEYNRVPPSSSARNKAFPHP
jgi:hypothetical protein